MNVQEILELAGKNNATGSFTAEVNGLQFLKATTFAFHRHENFFAVVGDEKTISAVVFDIPASLVGNGPHQVLLSQGQQLLHWYAKFKSEIEGESDINYVQSGSATVNFSNDRKRVHGTISFGLLNNRLVTGKFDISNE